MLYPCKVISIKLENGMQFQIQTQIKITLCRLIYTTNTLYSSDSDMSNTQAKESYIYYLEIRNIKKQN